MLATVAHRGGSHSLLGKLLQHMVAFPTMRELHSVNLTKVLSG